MRVLDNRSKLILMLRFLGVKWIEWKEPKAGWPSRIEWYSRNHPQGKFYFSETAGLSFLSPIVNVNHLDKLFPEVLSQDLLRSVELRCRTKAIQMPFNPNIPGFGQLLLRLYQMDLSSQNL